MKKLLLFFLVSAIMLTSVYAATISGGTYDDALTKLKDVVLEINTVPKQTFVSKDGSYSFEVPPGTYTIKAMHKGGAYAEENITIVKEGKYTLDLILFPNLDNIEQETSNNTIFDELDKEALNATAPERPMNYGLYAAIVIVLAAIIFLLVRYLKKPKAMSEAERPAEGSAKEDLVEMISAIKKLGGRTTQKDLRKELPYSEAKISLMLTELEHKKKIERIKKGRGNIIILR